MEVINNIQKKIYEALNRKYTIVDVPEDNTTLPFIRLAECDYNIERSKGSKKKSYNLEQQLHIWSSYEGKREVNAFMEEVIDIVEEIDFEYNTICNYCISSDVIDLEGFKQGILTFNIKIDK